MLQTDFSSVPGNFDQDIILWKYDDFSCHLPVSTLGMISRSAEPHDKLTLLHLGTTYSSISAALSTRRVGFGYVILLNNLLL